VNQGQDQPQYQTQQGGSVSYYPYPYPYSYLYPDTYTQSSGYQYSYDQYGRLVYGYGYDGRYPYPTLDSAIESTEWSYEYLCYRLPYLCQPIIPYAYAQSQPNPNPAVVQRQVQTPPIREYHNQEFADIPAVVAIPTMTPGTMMGISNLENAFFPLLVGAIALLVIFDYSS
jgi:hypothetical protein